MKLMADISGWRAWPGHQRYVVTQFCDFSILAEPQYVFNLPSRLDGSFLLDYKTIIWTQIYP